MLKTIPRQEIEDRIKEIENDKGAPIKFLKRYQVLTRLHQILRIGLSPLRTIGKKKQRRN